MRQLSLEEAAFLYADGSRAGGHAHANVTLVLVYDPSSAPRGRLRFKDLLHLVDARLHRVPELRQRLLRTPFELDAPWWIEDDRFDLEYHVRHIALPEPGDWRQLCIQASRIHARPLDLARPLWELYLVDRLDAIDGLPADSFALLLKLHHAAVDPGQGPDLALWLHDTVADAPPPGPPEPWFPASAPTGREMWLRVMQHNLASPLASVRPLWRAAARTLPRLLGALGDAVLHPDHFPTARFNAEVSPHRVFETRRFDESQVESVRRLVRGAAAEDVLLATVGGGLRRYLAHYDELPATGLVALTSPAAAAGEPHRRGWLHRVALGTEVADPVERLRTVHRARVRARASERTRAARDLAEATARAPAAALLGAARGVNTVTAAAAHGIPVANCTVVHAPGPALPLYLQGARLTYCSAMLPVADGLGLTFAVTRYDGRVFLSPTACREQLPDPEFLAQCLHESFGEYLAAARRRPRPSAARSRSPRGAPAARTAATRPRAARAGRLRPTSR